jgi:hypothetical protein
MRELSRIRREKARESKSVLTQEEIESAVKEGFMKPELLGKDAEGRVTYSGIPIEDLKRIDEKDGKHWAA